MLTIERQIAEMLIAHKVCGRRETRERARTLLDMVGIPEAGTRLDAYPDELSGGMRQRVLIAMALSCGPELLIADEPTTALDVTVQDQILELMRRLRRELGMAIIWISHDLGTVAGLADRVIIMYAGRIMEEAPVGELYRSPAPSLHPRPAAFDSAARRRTRPHAARDRGHAARPRRLSRGLPVPRPLPARGRPLPRAAPGAGDRRSTPSSRLLAPRRVDRPASAEHVFLTTCELDILSRVDLHS